MMAARPYLKQALIIKLLNRPLRHSTHCLNRLGKTDQMILSAGQLVNLALSTASCGASPSFLITTYLHPDAALCPQVFPIFVRLISVVSFPFVKAAFR